MKTLDQVLNEFELLINDNDYVFELKKDTIEYPKNKKWYLDIMDEEAEYIFSESSTDLKELLILGIEKIKGLV